MSLQCGQSNAGLDKKFPTLLLTIECEDPPDSSRSQTRICIVFAFINQPVPIDLKRQRSWLQSTKIRAFLNSDCVGNVLTVPRPSHILENSSANLLIPKPTTPPAWPANRIPRHGSEYKSVVLFQLDSTKASCDVALRSLQDW